MCLRSLFEGTVPWRPWFEPGSRHKIGRGVFAVQDFGRCFTAVQEVILVGLGCNTLPFGV